MFIKNGDLQPIAVLDPVDIDDKQTKKVLEETLKNAKEAVKEEKKEVGTA